jgi:hypothetical protein
MESFNTDSGLRSHTTSDTEVYLLLRLANRMEEPKHSRAMMKLRKIMQYRNMRVPPKGASLVTGYPANKDFRESLKKFLKQTIKEHKEACIPLHMPTCKPVEGSFPTIAKMLNNFREFTKDWRMETDQECVCEKYRGVLPHSAFTENYHVATIGANLNALSEEAKTVAASSLAETIYPSKKNFERDLPREVVEYWKRHKIGTHLWGGDEGLKAKTVAWIRTEWEKHAQEIKDSRKITKDNIEEIKKKYPDLIWQFEDHRHTQLWAFCPKLYSDMLWRTFIPKSEGIHSRDEHGGRSTPADKSKTTKKSPERMPLDPEQTQTRQRTEKTSRKTTTVRILLAEEEKRFPNGKTSHTFCLFFLAASTSSSRESFSGRGKRNLWQQHF